MPDQRHGKTLDSCHLQVPRCESLTRHHRRESCDARASHSLFSVVGVAGENLLGAIELLE